MEMIAGMSPTGDALLVGENSDSDMERGESPNYKIHQTQSLSGHSFGFKGICEFPVSEE